MENINLVKSEHNGVISCSDFALNIIRLGNKLFFYSSLLAISKKHNMELILPDYYLWKYLKNPPTISDKIGDINFSLPDDEYKRNEIDIFFKDNQNKFINYRPTYQTESCFDFCKEHVHYSLQFKDEIVDNVKKKYSSFLSKPTIGISIRLGFDMVNNSCFYNIPNEWYLESLYKHFPNWENEYNVVVFSDNIDTAKEIFKNYNFYYAEKNNTHNFIMGVDNSEEGIEHLILGSLMDNFIISQSTFSWWQAWLSKNKPNNENGKIIHSGRNFDGHFLEMFKNKHYYSNEWIENKINTITTYEKRNFRNYYESQH
jgi:hypothetical protein